jgi:hypothetical protein
LKNVARILLQTIWRRGERINKYAGIVGSHNRVMRQKRERSVEISSTDVKENGEDI